MPSQDFLQDYVEEVREHLIDMERSLLLLEQEGVDREQIAQVFRAAHSIKGASACMGFEGLTGLTHELESLISAVQSSARSVPPAGISLLLDCVDLISKAVDHVKQNGREPAIDSSLLENLHEAFFKEGLVTEKSVPESPAGRPLQAEGMESEAGPGAGDRSTGRRQEPLLVEEEDEELLGIFVSSFQENMSRLLGILNDSTQPNMSADELPTILELVEKLMSSARYMDYQSVVAKLEEWSQSLQPDHGRPPTRRKALESLEAHMVNFQLQVPQLAIPSSLEPPSFFPELPIEEEDQELFSIFMDSFQQNLLRLAETISGQTPDKVSLEKASELTDSLIQSSRYMDYTQIVELLEEWQGALSAFKEMDARDLGPLRGMLSTIAGKIKHHLTGLNLPVFEREEPEDPFAGLLDEEMDFAFGAAEKTASPAPQPGDLPVPAAAAYSGQEQTSPAPVRPKGDLGKYMAKERGSFFSEEGPQNAATLRVDAQKVDQLLNQVGELVVNRSEFIQTATFFRDVVRDLASQGLLPKQELRRLKLLNFRMNESTQSLGRIANDLQASVMRIRMLPISQLFQRFPRIVRDQALKLGKWVELVVEGGDTEIDKRVLEQMNDPLVQFLRNAIAHGVESPEERRKAGKPETGIIRLSATHAGDYVVVEIEDDGRGIDTQKLRDLLLSRNAVSRRELERLTDAEIVYSIFMPGMSTYDKVDGAAGRGVGLDVVKQNVEHMNGTVEVESQPGRGVKFLIRIPLTVAIIRALLVREGDQIFTLPLTSVTEILRYRPADTHSIESFKVITLRGKTIPLVDLGELLNMNRRRTDKEGRFVVIVSTSFREVGLVVDGLMGEREVVLKSIENSFQPVEGFSGATILGDGRVSLIVDVSALLRLMKNSPTSSVHSFGDEQFVN
jgi:two-component system chemotaxis sensor kinase CheA